jgi:hypothetical protein
MKTGIYLQTDFKDYYDEYLHDVMATERFKRLSRSGPSRPEIFKLLEEKSCPVPPYGTAEELWREYLDPDDPYCDVRWEKAIKSDIAWISHKLVVYDDIDAHRGEGKRLVKAYDYKEHIKPIKDKFCSLHLTIQDVFALSYRELFVGNRSFFLSYQSLIPDEWRSNYIDVKVNLYSECSPIRNFDYPIYAIDYIDIPTINTHEPGVRCTRNVYLDLNIAPGMPEGCGFEDLLPPEEASQEILSFIKQGKVDDESIK